MSRGRDIWTSGCLGTETSRTRTPGSCHAYLPSRPTPPAGTLCVSAVCRSFDSTQTSSPGGESLWLYQWLLASTTVPDRSFSGPRPRTRPETDLAPTDTRPGTPGSVLCWKRRDTDSEGYYSCSCCRLRVPVWVPFGEETFEWGWGSQRDEGFWTAYHPRNETSTHSRRRSTRPLVVVPTKHFAPGGISFALQGLYPPPCRCGRREERSRRGDRPREGWGAGGNYDFRFWDPSSCVLLSTKRFTPWGSARS